MDRALAAVWALAPALVSAVPAVADDGCGVGMDYDYTNGQRQPWVPVGVNVNADIPVPIPNFNPIPAINPIPNTHPPVIHGGGAPIQGGGRR